jgi:Ca-activated chloride channel family protein
MTDKREDYEDRLMEVALREKLSGRGAPEVTKPVLAGAPPVSSPSPFAAPRRWNARTWGLLAVSACLLVAVACTSWMVADSKHQSVAMTATSSPEAEGVFAKRRMWDEQRYDQHFTEGEESRLNEQLAYLPMAAKQGGAAPQPVQQGQRGITPRFTRSLDAGLVDAEEPLAEYATPHPAATKHYRFKQTETEGKWAVRQFSAAAQTEAPPTNLYADIDMTAALGKSVKVEPLTELNAVELQLAPEVRESERLLRLESETLDRGLGPGEGGDKYNRIVENPFLRTLDSPLSTFSIDVDTASYSKTRMYLLQNRTLPPPDAVRIEELVNYFDYDYPGPQDEHPFAARLEAAECPWNPEHRLVRVALKGREIEKERPASNLVFLLDVSGSMDEPNKLPLVKEGMTMLVRQLGENDRVAIVVYAGAAGLVLPSTRGTEQAAILEAIERLHAGGSTNGGEGIQLAYQTALDNFITGGVNRVILCTDGDFNVGVTSTGDLTRLAEENAKAGVFLSVLGFGMGNHNDAMLEEISGKANGNYAFIDTENEARKVLVEQMNSTLVTIAKDVKIQVEFNPAQVAAYRLVGYENRMLAAEDFNDDKKDAGEIGAGHSVTALYEIIPVQAKQAADTVAPPAVDDLKYQKDRKLTEAAESGELLTLKLRYKKPDEDQSTLMTMPLEGAGERFSAASRDFQFAAAVAAFGLILRDSQFQGELTLDGVQEIAESAKGEDRHGYRAEFLQMVEAARQLRGK